MFRCLAVMSLQMLLIVAVIGAVVKAEPSDRYWLRYGHDQRLTGRTSLKGDIAEPHVAWSFDTAGVEIEFELSATSSDHKFVLDGGAQPVSADTNRGEQTPRRVETAHERWADLVPATPGLEKITWNHTATTEKVCRLQCFSYADPNNPVLLWESDPPEDTIFSPLNIIDDIDGDGVLEVCVAVHYRVMIFEGTTGRKESELRYHSSRPYGWFGLYDVNTDGQKELITIGDFQSHVDVINFDPAKPEAERLAVRWRLDIETNIDKRQTWPQVGPYPLVDVDGDGMPEIVINWFNADDSGEWCVTVFDARTGAIDWRLPSAYLAGHAPLDATPGSELLVIRTQGLRVPRMGTIEIRSAAASMREGLVWSAMHARWLSVDDVELGDNWSTRATDGRRTVQVRREEGRHAIWFERLSGTEASPASDEPGGLFKLLIDPDADLAARRVLRDVPFPIELLDVGGRFRVTLPRSEAWRSVAEDHELVVRSAERATLPLSMPVIAPIASASSAAIIVEAPGDRVIAIAPPSALDEAGAQVLWTRPGRGMADGSRAAGVLAADLNDDGACEIVVADYRSDGAAELVAYTGGDGGVLWRRAFDDIPGDRPVWNVGALTFWWPGQFRARGKTDVFVNTRRQQMHSDRGHLLDGRTGDVMWQRDKATYGELFSWGYAGSPIAVADLTGDAIQELISLYPVCFWIGDGITGELLMGKNLAQRKDPPAWAAYGEPLLHDFTGDGKLDVLLDSVYILALLDHEGGVLWHGKPRAEFPTDPVAGNVGETTTTKHALIDFDGDGTFEIASAGYGDGARAIDPRTGEVLWSLDVPKPAMHKVAACDINGDGGDELLYTSGTELIAVTGNRSSGRVLWRWQADANLSMPAIGDVDGDDLAEIVVQTGDGRVVCLDGAKH